MAISADSPAGEIARGRGGFYRSSDGKPYIVDPSGDLVKSGARKGMPKRLVYGSPSGAGKLIENTYNLQKWGERMVAVGIGTDLALIADCHALTQLERDTKEFREAADRVAVLAKNAAQSMLAADRGTHAHALSEDQDEERDWILRAEAGEVLGLDREVQASLVQAWRDCIEREGLEMLAVEASCVDDAWRLAGTLDRIARCTKALRFALITGEIVEIPAGTVLVLDVKSGRRRTRPDGTVEYWQAYAVQIASYAQSVPYDTETEQRGEWPWPIDQTHALIAHLDVLGAIDGKPSCELVYVDLVAGREHGGATVVQAKAWESRRDVFSVAQLAAGESSEPPANGSGSATPDVAAPAAPNVTTAVDSATGTLSPEAPSSPAQGDESMTGAAGVHDNVTPAPAWPDAPNEGDTVDQAAVDALSARYKTLPDPVRKGWFANLAHEATTGVNGYGRCTFQLGGKTGLHSVRRFEITRGLVTLAEHGQAEGQDVGDDTLRAIVAAIVGDTAWWPTWLPGQVVGQLDATEAATFARLCDTFATTTVAGSISPDGRLVLGFDLAALAA